LTAGLRATEALGQRLSTLDPDAETAGNPKGRDKNLTTGDKWTPERAASILQGPSSYVRGMAKESIDRLISAGTISRYNDGESLGLAGETIKDLDIVLCGTIRAEKVTPDGRAHVFAMLEPGNMSGLFGVIDGLPNPHDHVAQGPTVTLRVPAKSVHQLIDNDKDFRDAILALFCERLRYSFSALHEYAIAPPIARLASRLLWLAQSHGRPTKDGTLLDLRLTQDSLGAMIGVSRQSTNGLLKDLVHDGVLSMDGRKITVANREALLSLAYAE
jgi:CRP/FNR family transcriptional regulator, cyclic AMP receptor protein